MVIIVAMLNRLGLILERLIIVVICLLLLTSSAPLSTSTFDKVRAYTRDIEFDYIAWMLNATGIKIEQGAAGIPGYLDNESSKVAVTTYLQVTQQIIQGEAALNRVYADASIKDKEAASTAIRAQLTDLYKQQADLAPFAEAVLQKQVATVAADFGLTTLGQPIPTFHHFRADLAPGNIGGCFVHRPHCMDDFVQ